jgi:hypothetical protein
MYYNSDSPFFFAFEGGAHTIERGTWQFRVQEFDSYLTLWFCAIFATRFVWSCWCKVSVFKPTIQDIFFHFIYKIFKSCECTGFEIILWFKSEFIFDFNSPVFTCLRWEEVSGLIWSLRAFLLLWEHSHIVLGCLQHDVLGLHFCWCNGGIVSWFAALLSAAITQVYWSSRKAACALC